MKVSELNLKAKTLLEGHFTDIELNGELSKITLHGSGHWYFELKDERASISCVMYRGANAAVGFVPKVGDALLLSGGVTIYETSGRYQFIAKTLKMAGAGDLEAKFKALKERLEKEGLFARKRLLPRFLHRIGIITSHTGAALADMMKILESRGNFLPQIFIINALVQGTNAPASIIKALKKADSMHLDVIIIARGGGSREDLFCFNDEALARAIFATQTPTVSAIGHEIDYVISDFVADKRCPTPSAAVAECILSLAELYQELDIMQDKIESCIKNKVSTLENAVKSLQMLLKAHSLYKIIGEKFTHLNVLKEQLKMLINSRFERDFAALNALNSALKQHNAFFDRMKFMVSIKKDGRNFELEKLEKGDIINLCGLYTSKKAKIL